MRIYLCVLEQGNDVGIIHYTTMQIILAKLEVREMCLVALQFLDRSSDIVIDRRMVHDGLYFCESFSIQSSNSVSADGLDQMPIALVVFPPLDARSMRSLFLSFCSIIDFLPPPPMTAKK
jgi:hypothetical protein